jgi:hypothetical protein
LAGGLAVKGEIRVISIPLVIAGTRAEVTVPAGGTLEEIIAAHWAEPYPCQAEVRGAIIAPEWWSRVKPRPGADVILAGVPGDGQTGLMAAQAALSLAAMIAFIIPGGQWVGVGLAVAAAGLSVGGSYLFPPPSPSLTQAPVPTAYVPAAVVTNEARPYRAIPVLYGQMRLMPPVAAKPALRYNGQQAFTRVILAISCGMCDVSEIRIGETPIENFTGVTTEFRRGWHASQIVAAGNHSSSSYPSSPVFGGTYTRTTAGTITALDDAGASVGRDVEDGQTLTYNGLKAYNYHSAWDLDQMRGFRLYPLASQIETFDVAMSSAVSVTRSAPAAGHRWSIRGMFKYGLYRTENSPPGKINSKSVTMKVEWRKIGDVSWKTSFNASVTNAVTSAWEWGHNFKHDGDDIEIEIRVTRTTQPGDNAYEDRFWWQLIDVETGEAPVPIGGICMLAVEVKATGQLNGPLDQLSMLAKRMAWRWGSLAWDTFGPTRNPASMALATLQDPFAPWAKPDAKLRLDQFGEWYDYCVANNFNCDGYVEDAEDLNGSLLTDIGIAGFAAITKELDGTRSVIIDRPRSNDGTLITPSNSWGFTLKTPRPRLPQAWRVAFLNPEKNYDVDEQIVYAPGYSAADDDTITDIQRFETRFITDAGVAWKRVRRHENRSRIGRRQITVRQDFEGMRVSRGDRCTVVYPVVCDAPMDSGRIKQTIGNFGYVQQVVLDKAVDPPPSGKQCVLIAYSANGVGTIYPITQLSAASATLDLATPTLDAYAPAAGYIWAYTATTNGTFDGQVEAVVPAADRSVEITLAEYSDDIFADDTATPPAWESTLPDRTLPPLQVTSVISDISVARVTSSGAIVPRVEFWYSDNLPSGVDATVFVNARLSMTDGEYSALVLSESGPGYVIFEGVAEGFAYDFAIWRTAPGYIAGANAYVSNHVVVCRLDPPSALTGFSVVVLGGMVLLSWAPIQELDVIGGGRVDIYHALETSGATLSNARTLGVSVPGSTTTAFAPALKGTYFSVVYDALGLASPSVSVVLADTTSVLAYSTAGYCQDDATWSGVKTNTETSSGSLRLTQPSSVVTAAGDYVGNAGVDLGSVLTARWRVHLKTAIVAAGDTIRARGNVRSWQNVRGTLTESTDCDAYVESRFTNDDPAGSPTWGPWQRLEAAEVKARAMDKPKLFLVSRDTTRNINASEFRVYAEVV